MGLKLGRVIAVVKAQKFKGGYTVLVTIPALLRHKQNIHQGNFLEVREISDGDAVLNGIFYSKQPGEKPANPGRTRNDPARSRE